MVVCGVIWGASYGFMFVLKWLLAVGALGWQALGSALESAEYRISGTVYLGNTNLDPEASGIQRLTGAIFRNQGCLFPFREEMQMGVVFWICTGVLFLCIAVIYMFRAKNFSWEMISLCLLPGFVPYLRYMALQVLICRRAVKYIFVLPLICSKIYKCIVRQMDSLRRL